MRLLKNSDKQTTTTKNVYIEIDGGQCFYEPYECDIFLAGDCDGENGEKCCGSVFHYPVCSECAGRYTDADIFCAALSLLAEDELLPPYVAPGGKLVLRIEARPREG